MKKKLGAILLAILCLFALSACKQKEDIPEEDIQLGIEDEAQDEDMDEQAVSYTFGFSCITMDNPYFVALEASLREGLESGGHTLITTDAKADANLQAEQILDLIEKKIDAIFLAPVDWIEIGSSIDLLKEAGIKIINVDTQVQEFDKVDAYVGSNNSDAGYMCGKDLLEKAPEGGNIIIVECSNRNSINERIKGFERAIAGKGFSVVKRVNADTDSSAMLSEVKDVLATEENIVAIMCGNDLTALGAMAAAKEAGAENVLIYGIDGSPEIKQELVKENSMITATAGQSTKEIGKVAAEVAIQVLNGESYEKTTYIPTVLIQQENVADYGTDSWQ